MEQQGWSGTLTNKEQSLDTMGSLCIKDTLCVQSRQELTGHVRGFQGHVAARLPVKPWGTGGRE